MPLDYIHLAIPAFLGLLALEAIADARMRADLYEWRDTAASLTMGLGNVIVNLAAKPITFAILLWAYRFAPIKLGFAWWVWVIAFFAEDFSYYWFHRTSHESRFFWASHVVHHSSQRYNLGTALRQTWTGSVTGWIFWLWTPFAGFHPVMIMSLQAFSLLYQFWIHTELIRSTGAAFEAVMNTPAHHRVHHGSNPQYIDRNHAGWLIIWDKLFGTFEPENEKVRYGLTTNIGTYNPVRIAFHEWFDIARDVLHAHSWRARWRYIFANPGWREEDSKSTTASA